MAISVSFYDLAKAENSTKRPAGNSAGLTANCNLKAPTDVLNPVIELRLASASTFPAYNYAYISDFSRYYWITNWEWQAGFWLAYLKVDVLATYKTYLGSRTFYVLRQALNYDTFIKDEMYPLSGQYTESRTPLANPWWESITSYTSTGCYVVGVIGTNTVSGSTRGNGMSYYVMDPAGFRSFTDAILNKNLTAYDMADLIASVGEAMARIIVKPMEYITSVLWYPFSIPSDLIIAANKVAGFTSGFFDFSAGSGNIYVMPDTYQATFYASWSLQKHPLTQNRGVYLNGSPYTDITLELPRIKTIPVDVNRLIMSAQLNVTLYVDMCSGEGEYIIASRETVNAAYTIPMDTYPVKIGVELNLANDQISINDITDVISSTVATAASAATGNIPGAIVSGGSAIGSVSNLFAPHITTVGAVGSFLQLAGQLGLPVLYYRFHTPTNDDNTHNGRPLCQNVNLGSGYNKVLDGSVEISGAYLPEIQQVRAYLENGMYYE